MTHSVDSDVRRLVREVIMEVLPEVHDAHVREVTIRDDADLAVFIEQVMNVAHDAKSFERYRSGKLRFVWVPGTPGETPREGSGDRTSVDQPSEVALTNSPARPSLHIDKGAVTERMVAQAAAEGSRIVLGKGAVVTPLAREFARKNKVPLERPR